MLFCDSVYLFGWQSKQQIIESKKTYSVNQAPKQKGVQKNKSTNLLTPLQLEDLQPKISSYTNVENIII